ncbi:hypothetical protein RB620_17970 [Paenibacillus sp. LHD-117]|uniref:hypothetical protein n=1 Tax=Paenibacillus sp. LHD-117 TaxID=3071412 RepID=UPI0027E16219|nr:hypothetical protein [Paenibacillus sp. LHD-117]MDQ6421316.1 hypothetical protein [Paenibacillus sp. LHD-117]
MADGGWFVGETDKVDQKRPETGQFVGETDKVDSKRPEIGQFVGGTDLKAPKVGERCVKAKKRAANGSLFLNPLVALFCYAAAYEECFVTV